MGKFDSRTYQTPTSSAGSILPGGRGTFGRAVAQAAEAALSAAASARPARRRRDRPGELDMTIHRYPIEVLDEMCEELYGPEGRGARARQKKGVRDPITTQVTCTTRASSAIAIATAAET